MRDLIARLFSKRIRELERINADLDAMLGDDFSKVSITRMNFTPETGLAATFDGPNIAKLIAAWAMNTLEAVDAKNYVEFQVLDRQGEHGPILITVQRVWGETPGSKVARLEKELAATKAA